MLYKHFAPGPRSHSSADTKPPSHQSLQPTRKRKLPSPSPKEANLITQQAYQSDAHSLTSVLTVREHSQYTQAPITFLYKAALSESIYSTVRGICNCTYRLHEAVGPQPQYAISVNCTCTIQTYVMYMDCASYFAFYKCLDASMYSYARFVTYMCLDASAQTPVANNYFVCLDSLLSAFLHTLANAP